MGYCQGGERDEVSGPFGARHNLWVIVRVSIRSRTECQRTMSREQAGAWTVGEFVMDSGHCPIRQFLAGLTGRHDQEALALLAALREFGAALRPPRSKLVETGLFELRGHQVRMFYMFRPGRRIVLLDGIIKKQDEIPRDVLKRVRRYMKEVEASEEASS